MPMSTGRRSMLKVAAVVVCCCLLLPVATSTTAASAATVGDTSLPSYIPPRLYTFLSTLASQHCVSTASCQSPSFDSLQLHLQHQQQQQQQQQQQRITQIFQQFSSSSPLHSSASLSSSSSSSCQEDLMNIFNPASVHPFASNVTCQVILDSFGHGFGDLGDYGSCSQLAPLVQYAWVAQRMRTTPFPFGPYPDENVENVGSISVPYSLQTALGVCVPMSCDKTSLPETITFLLSIIFNTTMSPQTLYTHFVEPVYEDNEAWLNTFIIVLFIALCVPTVVATTIHCAQMRNWCMSCCGYTSSNEEEGRYGSLSKPSAGSKGMDGHGPITSAGDDDDRRGSGMGMERGGDRRGSVRGHDLGHGYLPLGGAEDLDSDEHTKGWCSPRLIHTFSAVRAFASLLYSPEEARESRQLQAIHGIKVLSIWWVILGQSFVLLDGLLRNQVFFDKYVSKRFSFQVISSSVLALDTFFFLSGFLAARSIVHLIYRYHLNPAQNAIQGASSAAGVDRSGKSAMAGRASDQYQGYFAVFFKYVFCDRALRNIPALGFTIFLGYFIAPLMANGPLWYRYKYRVSFNCDNSWWTTLLFVNNFYPTQFDSVCMNWTYFFSVDMQLLLLSSVLLYVYLHRPYTGVFMTVCVAIASCITRGVLVFNNSLIPNFVVDDDEYHNMVVTKPWCRAAPYMVGLLAYFAYAKLHQRRVILSMNSGNSGARRNSGALNMSSKTSFATANRLGLLSVSEEYHSSPESDHSLSPGEYAGTKKGRELDAQEWFRQNWIVDDGFVDNSLLNQPAFLDVEVYGYEVPFSVLSIMGWIFAIACILSAVFSPYSDYNSVDMVSCWSYISNAWYSALAPLGFVLGMAVFLLMCALGQGGLIDVFLSSFFWQPLSRLAFATYLAHPIIIFGAYSSAGSLFYFRDIEMMYLFVTNVILSTALGVVIYTLVQRPIKVIVQGQGWRNT